MQRHCLRTRNTEEGLVAVQPHFYNVTLAGIRIVAELWPKRTVSLMTSVEE